MQALLGTTVRWLLRHFVNLLLIIAVLLLGRLFWTEWQAFQSVRAESTQLAAADADLTARLSQLGRSASERAAGLSTASQHMLELRLSALDREIALSQLQKQQSGGWSKVLAGSSIVQAQIDGLRLDAEINLLEQERAYLTELKLRLLAAQSGVARRVELERLWQVHQHRYLAWQDIKLKKETLIQLHPVKSRLPGTDEYQARERLQTQQDFLLAQNRQADADYQRQLRLMQAIRPLPPLATFRPDSARIDEILQPLRRRIADLEALRQGNWIGKLWRPVQEVAATALLILLGIILTPIAIKALFYFVLAPLAARRPPLRLLPEACGALELESGRSAVSMPVVLDAELELLVHPEFLQSASIHGEKDTCWLLSWQFPLTSLASGMVALTRIRTGTRQTCVISATRDPLSEIGILSVPQGAALVMQPHNLVGVVQSRNAPLRITSHWRLGSLHAWLTLQLRYLAFHGPARLIVQGCRGVRIEPADTGRAINQAATIGFSANLAYATRRCETFFAYLQGKQELLNDTFSGEENKAGDNGEKGEKVSSGFYVYEEMPHPARKTGLTGRGLEGFTDSLLKVLGV